MKPKTLLYLSVGSFLLGVLFCALKLLQPVTLTIDGRTITVPHGSWTAGTLLESQGYEIHPGDQIRPQAWQPLLFTRHIELITSSEVTVYNGDQLVSFTSVERYPANLLQLAGIRLFPYDTVIANGQYVQTDTLLAPASRHILQYRTAVPVNYTDGNDNLSFYSSAATIGAALWQQGIHMEPGDTINPSIETHLTGPVSIVLTHGRELTIIDGGVAKIIWSNANTVSDALLDAGLAPQGLDYCSPAEDQPIPGDGVIHLVRVREEVSLNQTPIPNSIEYQADANTELDQQAVIDAGEYGLKTQQVRVRYENGQEVSRQTETEWVSREPRPQIIGYGTKVIIRTIQVDGMSIDYWRSVTVYATSYSPCNSGTAECLGKTANGMTVEKGVVGVIRSWYNLMNGQYIYVPGYGSAVIADIGAGVAGKDWIDLGYSDVDYVPWHSNVTIYFLTPVPDSVPWILP